MHAGGHACHACPADADPRRSRPGGDGGRDLSGEAIVTGQENLQERQRGFREALQDAVVKASGDSRLAGDPRLGPALGDAEAYVSAFAYEDRLARKTMMDEQGTRERSYFLRVDFDPTKLDHLLAELGARPWGTDRPHLLVLLGIRDTIGPYALGTDSERGWGQREALLAIARRRGLPVLLPRTGSGEAPVVVPYQDIAAAVDNDRRTVERLRRAYAADAVLSGEMVITPESLWNTRWTLGASPVATSWRVDATTFDRAIAAGLDGSARRLAGID